MLRTKLLACASVLAVLGLLPAARGEEADLTVQKERQKQIQAETDQFVKKIGTMLRVLEYYHVDQAAEQKMLMEVAVALSGLSKDQMTQVIARLDAAAQTADKTKSEQEIKEAYARHREIITTLKGLLAKYDAVKSLDQVAERLDKSAKIQLDMHLQTADIIKNIEDRQRPDLDQSRRLAVFRKYPNLYLEQKRQGDGEADLQQEVMLLLKQASALKANLSAELKNRLKNMEDLAAKQRLQESFYLVVSKLRAQGYQANRIENWKSGNALQFQIAGNLRELARALRKNPDAVAALREAQARIDQAIREQETITKETKEQTPKNEDAKTDPKKLTFPGTEPLPNVKTPPKKPLSPVDAVQAKKDAEAAEKAAELGKKQTVLEFETQETENLVKPVAKEAAEKVKSAEKAMEEAKKALAKNEPEKAGKPQEQAAAALKEA